ncbi:MAG: hypothetical protein ACMXYB_03335 [Candidatus Woesearchaeota archaeon]
MKHLDILKLFIKEELRMHSSLYKFSNFYSYPITLLVFFAGITLLSLLVYDSININMVVPTILLLFTIAGAMSGAFGLFAKDFLERVFPNSNRLLAHSRIFPISLKSTLLLFSISDSFFYFFWFIIPTLLGFSMVSIAFGQLSIIFAFLLILVSTLHFMLGLYIFFFISFLFEQSKLLFILSSGIIVAIFSYLYLTLGITQSLGIGLLLNFDFFQLFILILLIIIAMVLSYFCVNERFETKTFSSSSSQRKSISFNSTYSPLIIKDFIDLKRTGGIIGKPLFTILIPSILVLLLFSTIEILRDLQIDVLFFAIIFATLATQLLNSLIMSDSHRYYRYLPIMFKQYFLPKVHLTFRITMLLGTTVLLIYSYFFSVFEWIRIVQGIFILAVISLYNFGLSFWLTGLRPNERLMQSSVFIIYFLCFLPMLIVTILVHLLFTSILYQILYVVVGILLSLLFLVLGFRKWNKEFIEDE